MHKGLELHASHLEFITLVVEKHDAFFADKLFDITVELPPPQSSQVTNLLFEPIEPGIAMPDDSLDASNAINRQEPFLQSTQDTDEFLQFVK